jgi:hypothetical protein
MIVLRFVALSEQSFRNCVIRALFRFYRIETGLWNFDLTRFLDANRYPRSLSSGAHSRDPLA